MVLLDTPIHVDALQTRANCLGTSTCRDSSPKTVILTTLPPQCLQLWTTWKL